MCAATDIAIDSMTAAVEKSWTSNVAVIVQGYLLKADGRQMR